MDNTLAINHDRETGRLTNAGAFEWLGIRAMSLAGKLTSPISHVGYSWLTRAIRIALPSRRLVLTKLEEDTYFAYPYGDLYWSRLADRDESYAPDVELFLDGVRHVDYAFIDCGANFGYFAALVSSKAYGSKKAIAIEADPSTYEQLAKNASLNEDRFEVRHRAIFSVSGEVVSVFGEKHEARSIIAENETQQSHGNVTTLAPDDLQNWLEEMGTKKSILKLDVEGVEIKALNGSKQLLDTDCVVLYEDHASDKEHQVSKYVMEELGLTVFYPDLQGNCRRIESLEDLKKIKRNPRVGYDFLATKSKFWISEIEQLS